MEKAKNSSVWAEAGYNIFAEEGIEGIQVERLARILQLNKSSFYHYFGDLDGFYEELIKLHQTKADLFLAHVATVKSIDPDYLMLLVQHRVPCLFHLQLIRSKDNPLFYNTAIEIDRQEDLLIGELWGDYLGIHNHPTLAVRYFDIVRDMLYARLGSKNFNYHVLHDLMAEARAAMQQITENNAALETGDSRS